MKRNKLEEDRECCGDWYLDMLIVEKFLESMIFGRILGWVEGEDYKMIW